MPIDLLEYIGNATQVLQDAHQKYFKNKIMGSNVINLNYFFCYCIKVYDETTGKQRITKLWVAQLGEHLTEDQNVVSSSLALKTNILFFLIGSQEMRRWKRFIKLSPHSGKLGEYNKLFKLHLMVFRKHYSSMVIKTHNKTGARSRGMTNEESDHVQSVYEFQWPDIELEMGDLFVAESLKLD